MGEGKKELYQIHGVGSRYLEVKKQSRGTVLTVLKHCANWGYLGIIPGETLAECLPPWHGMF